MASSRPRTVASITLSPTTMRAPPISSGSTSTCAVTLRPNFASSAREQRLDLLVGHRQRRDDRGLEHAFVLALAALRTSARICGTSIEPAVLDQHLHEVAARGRRGARRARRGSAPSSARSSTFGSPMRLARSARRVTTASMSSSISDHCARLPALERELERRFGVGTCDGDELGHI